MEGLTTQGSIWIYLYKLKFIFFTNSIWKSVFHSGHYHGKCVCSELILWYSTYKFLVTKHADFSVPAYRKRTNISEQKGCAVSINDYTSHCKFTNGYFIFACPCLKLCLAV